MLCCCRSRKRSFLRVNFKETFKRSNEVNVSKTRESLSNKYYKGTKYYFRLSIDLPKRYRSSTNDRYLSTGNTKHDIRKKRKWLTSLLQPVSSHNAPIVARN